MQNEDTSLQSSPQLASGEQSGVVVALSGKQILSLYKKSEQSGIPFDTLKEVYERGYSIDFSEQTAYNRVNSFIAGGAAQQMDKDLLEKRGLWDNIWAKRKRIAAGSGEHMRKPGSKGAPTAAAFKASQTTSEAANPAQQAAIAIAMKKAGKKPKNEEYTGAEKVSNNADDPSNRFIGTTSLTNNFKQATPGQSTLSTIKKVVREQLEEMSVPAGTTGKRKEWHPPMVGIRMASGKIEKHPPGKSGSSGGGGGGGGSGGGGNGG